MADFEKIIREHVGDDGNIPTTAINAIVTAIKQAVGNEYVEKERYKAKLTEIDTLKEQKQTAEDNATTAEKWKTEYEKVKSDFDTYKSDIEKKESKAAKTDAVRAYLKEKNIKDEGNLEIILRGTRDEIDAIEFDKDGKIKDTKAFDDLIAGTYSKFVETSGQHGANTSTPPGSTGGNENKPNAAALRAQQYYAARYGAAPVQSGANN